MALRSAFLDTSNNSINGAGITVPAVSATSPLSYSSATGVISFSGAGAITWDQIGNAAGALTLANAGNATTFNQTSAVNWTWANTTAATSSVSQSSPFHIFTGQYWTGAAGAADSWQIQNKCSNGTNALTQLQFTHSGNSTTNIQLPAGTASIGSLTFGSVVNTGGTFGPGIFSSGAAALGFHPGDSSGAQGLTLNFYRINASAAATLSWDFTIGNAGTTATLEATENANGQVLIVSAALGTTAGRGITLGGNGGGNGKQFSATSGTQVAVSVGGPTSGTGFVTFNPTSGTATFVGFQVNPTINQTSTSSGNYTGLLVNAIETSLKGTANLLLDLQAGATGGTSEFAITNAGKVSKYNATTTAGNGVPANYAVADLTAQTAAKTATTIFTPTASGMFRISWAATITTAASVSSILGGTNGFQVLFTSPTDSVAKTTVSGNSVTSAANTTGTAAGGSITIYAKTGVAIQYQYDYTSSGTAMAYELHVSCESV